MSDALPPDTSKNYSESFRVRAATENSDDLHHAIAGREVGRQRRHIQGGDVDPITGEKRKSGSGAVHRTLEWLLLNDPNYARLYESAASAVGDAAQTAQHVLDQILTKTEAVQADLNDVLDRAMELPDGRKVFKDKDGNVRDENGAVIDDALAAGIIWQGDEPTYEDYRALMDRAADLQSAADDVRGIQTDLGDLDNRLNNNDEPLSPDDLKAVTDRAGALVDRLKQIESGLHITPGARDAALSAHSETLETTEHSTAAVPIVRIGG